MDLLKHGLGTLLIGLVFGFGCGSSGVLVQSKAVEEELRTTDQSDNVTVVARLLPGDNYTVHVQGEYAYLNAGTAILVLDISDQTNVRQVGLLTLPAVPLSGVYQVQAQGNFLYVSNGLGLRIVDIADPTQPTLVGTFLNRTIGLFVRDRYAYTTDGLRHLLVIDVADPTNPVWVGTFDSGDISAGNDVVVDGDFAYVAYNTLNGYRGLRIIDVSDPTQPTLAGELPTPGSAFNLAVAGHYAYLAHGPGGYRIVDVSDPRHPVSVSQRPTGNIAHGVYALGHYLYVANFNNSVFQVVDISDPVNPVTVSSISTTGVPWKLFARDDTVFLSKYDGLSLIDLSDPANPTPLDFFGTGTAALDVATGEGNAFIINGYASGGLQIVRATPLDSPKFLAQLPGLTARHVSVQGRLAYYTDSSFGLTIASVSDPANPVVLGRYNPEGSFTYGLAVQGSYAYVTNGTSPGTLYIVDVSNPTQPTQLAAVGVGLYAMDVKVAGKHAYVATRSDGLKILDISDPTAPREIGHYQPNDQVEGVFVQDHLAYLADGFRDIHATFSGLRIVDISDPANPKLLGSLHIGGTSHSVRVEGNYAYFCDHRGGLRIIDIADATNPREVGFFTLSTSAEEVALANGLIYLANGSQGVFVLRFDARE